jgi:tyrosine-protein kinase Etk/Wzc
MEQTAGYTKALKIILNRWYYLLAAVCLSLFCGYAFLFFIKPDYSSNASIKIDDRKSELSELIAIKNIYDRTSKSETEKFILYSRHVLSNAITAIDYKISFFSDVRFHKSNLYPQRPIAINILSIPAGKIHSTLFKFEALGPKEFRLSYKLRGFETSKQYAFGENIKLIGFSFKILPGDDNGRSLKTTYYFQFNEIEDYLSRVNAALEIEDNQNTNILNLTYTDPNPYFARDILNAILQEYQKFDRSQRSVSIRQTSFFIDTLLQNMALDVKKSALDIQEFKAANQMLNVSSNAESLINKLTSLETEQHNLTIQQVLTSELQQSLKNNKGTNTPNFNLQGVEDLQLVSLLNRYNLLSDKRNDVLKTYQPGTPFIIDIDKQINELKLAVTANIKSQHVKNKELHSYLHLQIKVIKTDIATAPALEKDYISLQSDYNINQKVYNYLSEKKLEAHISTAAVTSGAQVIDDAIVSSKPSYPIEANIYKDFVLAGLLLGILSIFAVRRFNPYLYEIETVEKLTTIPIIGSIRKHKGSVEPYKILSIDSPRSLFSESVRAMRANLHFMDAGNKGKVICITSEIAGEGKSFTSLNLAGTLCLIDKKVVVVATDLRKSQLHKTFQTTNLSGLSSYLSGQAALDQLCLTTRFRNLNFIPAGPVPPNPAELIQSVKMKELINYLQERYDFIILDSAPVGLVTDSIPLMRMADINFFVLRYGVSRRHAASLPSQLAHEFKLANMAIVLNAFKDPIHKSYYSLLPDEKAYEHYDSANGN